MSSDSPTTPLHHWQVTLCSRPVPPPARDPESRSRFLSIRGLRVLPTPAACGLARYQLVVQGVDELAVYDSLTASWPECEVETIALLPPLAWTTEAPARDR